MVLIMLGLTYIDYVYFKTKKSAQTRLTDLPQSGIADYYSYSCTTRVHFYPMPISIFIDVII